MWMLETQPGSCTRATMLLTVMLSPQSLILSIFFHHVTQEIRPGWENLRPLREKVESASFSVCARDREETGIRRTQSSVPFSWCQRNTEGTTSKRTQCFSSSSHLPWASACDNWEAESGFSGTGTNAGRVFRQYVLLIDS